MAYRHAPMEFCEVASMSMELLSMPHLNTFYAPQEVVRTAQSEWENKIGLFPWVCTIDAFQHWLYLNPGHSREERSAYWLELVRAPRIIVIRPTLPPFKKQLRT